MGDSSLKISRLELSKSPTTIERAGPITTDSDNDGEGKTDHGGMFATPSVDNKKTISKSAGRISDLTRKDLKIQS